MAYADQMPGSRRITTIAGVAIVHGLIGYALISGMAVDIVTKVSRTMTTTNIPVERPPEPEKTPPPTDHAVTKPTATTTVTVVDLPFPIPTSDRTVTVDVIPAFPLPPLPPLTVDATPPVASKAAGPQVRGDRSAWITTEDYPAAAIRAEEQGSVGIAVRIGADGRVTSCSVTASSGSGVLDDAACRLYQRRARFAPARDDAGQSVAATYSDRIRWQLPR